MGEQSQNNTVLLCNGNRLCDLANVPTIDFPEPSEDWSEMKYSVMRPCAFSVDCKFNVRAWWMLMPPRKVTKKRFMRLLMALGASRNDANFVACNVPNRIEYLRSVLGAPVITGVVA